MCKMMLNKQLQKNHDSNISHVSLVDSLSLVTPFDFSKGGDNRFLGGEGGEWRNWHYNSLHFTSLHFTSLNIYTYILSEDYPVLGCMRNDCCIPVLVMTEWYAYSSPTCTWYYTHHNVSRGGDCNSTNHIIWPNHIIRSNKCCRTTQHGSSTYGLLVGPTE